MFHFSNSVQTFEPERPPNVKTQNVEPGESGKKGKMDENG